MGQVIIENAVFLVVGAVALAVWAFYMLRDGDSTGASTIAERLENIRHMGREIYVEHLHWQFRGDRRHFTAYGIDLPGPLRAVGLIDAEASERWRTTDQYDQIDTIGSPVTGDDIFDGTFELTAPGDASALGQPEVRRLLLELHDGCGGLWLRDGRLWIVEEGRYTEVNGEISAELLVGIVEQLEAACEAGAAN